MGENNLQDAIVKFHEGDEEGFNYFFRLHYRVLVLFAYKITGEKEIAEEIAQDSFVTSWERRDRFNHPATLKSFLYTATKFSALNRLREIRKEKRRVREQTFDVSTDENTILSHMISAEVHDQVFRSISELPTQCRRIFRMLYFEGKDSTRIAEELGISVSTVYNQKARGIKLIKQSIILF